MPPFNICSVSSARNPMFDVKWIWIQACASVPTCSFLSLKPRAQPSFKGSQSLKKKKKPTRGPRLKPLSYPVSLVKWLWGRCWVVITSRVARTQIGCPFFERQQLLFIYFYAFGQRFSLLISKRWLLGGGTEAWPFVVSPVLTRLPWLFLSFLFLFFF